MNAGIIPATESKTGNFIVSIHTISQQYKYAAVVKRHLDNDVIGWFLKRKEYTPQELINGIRTELDYVNGIDGVAYRFNRNPYSAALTTALDIMVERYDLLDFPEYYI